MTAFVGFWDFEKKIVEGEFLRKEVRLNGCEIGHLFCFRTESCL
jgi:hypothetical protein